LQVYASSALTLQLVGASELVAAAPFTGVLRAAVVTLAAAQTVLDDYAGTYATLGAVSHTVSFPA
jgi:endoglucanase Acf2